MGAIWRHISIKQFLGFIFAVILALSGAIVTLVTYSYSGDRSAMNRIVQDIDKRVEKIECVKVATVEEMAKKLDTDRYMEDKHKRDMEMEAIRADIKETSRDVKKILHRIPPYQVQSTVATTVPPTVIK